MNIEDCMKHGYFDADGKRVPGLDGKFIEWVPREEWEYPFKTVDVPHDYLGGYERMRSHRLSQEQREKIRNGRIEWIQNHGAVVRSWTDDEVSLLMEMRTNGVPYGYIAEKLGRSHNSIQSKVRLLIATGLARPCRA